MRIHRLVRLVLVVLAVVASACGGGMRAFPNQDPMWSDDDQRPFAPAPAEYFSPFGWDAANQTIFRPVSRFFAVDPAGESVNVNALDEVPNSSWFENRLGHRPFTPEDMRRGPCPAAILDPDTGPWVVTDAKPNGANPGFIIEAPDESRWLLKFDGTDQPERATAADVVGSRIYYAVGYHGPCNIVVYFDPSVIEIADDAESEDSSGQSIPMTEADIETILAKGYRRSDGLYRASASLFLEGTPIGPWTYEGTRDDDPNDVVPHEDRRELRGMYTVAAWLNHFDSREQNTLATFIETEGERGYVRHNMIDFGDCFGSLWEFEGISRRLGHANYLDLSDVMVDFATFGFLPRPWDAPQYGPSGVVFGYYGVGRFEPDNWEPGYPNPAFSRRSERDMAWMARKLAHFDNELLWAAISEGRFSQEGIDRELFRLMRGRLDKILDRFLTRLSPLAYPTAENGTLCLTDLAVTSHTLPIETRRYAARGWLGTELAPTRVEGVRALGDGRVCMQLPGNDDGYLVIDVAGVSPGQDLVPARVHLYALGGGQHRVVGLERPNGDSAP